MSNTVIVHTSSGQVERREVSHTERSLNLSVPHSCTRQVKVGERQTLDDFANAVTDRRPRKIK